MATLCFITLNSGATTPQTDQDNIREKCIFLSVSNQYFKKPYSPGGLDKKMYYLKKQFIKKKFMNTHEHF